MKISQQAHTQATASWWTTPHTNKNGSIGSTPARGVVDAVSIGSSNTLVASTSALLANCFSSPIAKAGVAIGCGALGFVAGGTLTAMSVEGLNKSLHLPQQADDFQGALLGGATTGVIAGFGGAVAGAFGCSPGSVAIAAAASTSLLMGGIALSDLRQ